MNICKYCKSKGMTKEEYNNFRNNIKTIAQTIRSQLSYKNGVYYPVNEIIPYNSNLDMKYFIIQELKNLGIEFYNNNELYRVCE